MKELHIIRHNEFIALGHAVSFIGAYCGVITCEQLRLCSKQNQLKMLTRQMLLFFMAVANGGVAIWCTHLVGMSAVSFVDMDGNPVPNYYRLDFTIISLIISILFYFIGVNICSKDGAFVMDKMDTVNAFIEGATRMTISEIRKMRSKRDILLLSLFHRMQRLVVGTMITALGMSSMHFLGMTSLIIDRKVQIKWDVPLVIASVAVQITTSLITYWVYFRLLAIYPHKEILRVLSSCFVALSVNGIHFLGMAAAKFVIIDGELDFELGSNTYLIEKETSAIAAIIAAMLFLWALMFMNIADLRQWLQKRSRTLKSIANMMDEIEKNAVQTEFSKRIVRKYNAIDGVQESAPSADFFGYFTVDNFLSSEISCGGRMSIAGSRAGSFTRIRALSSQVNSTSEYTYEDGKQIKISSALSSEDNNSYGNALFRGDLLHDSSHRASFNRKSQPSLQVSTISNSSSKANINPNALINSRSNSIEKMSIGNRSTSLPNICSHTAENLNMSVTSNYDVATHSNVNRDLTPLSENISDSHDDGRVVPSLILLPRNVTHTLRIPKIFSSFRIAPIKTSPHTPESFDSIRKS